MKKLIILFFCCFAFSVHALAAQTKPGGVIVKKSAAAKNKPAAQPVLPEIKPVPFHIPQVQRVVTDSGIEAWLIEEKSTPAIAVSVLFKGGKASDPKRLTGLSSLAMSLMDEGSGPYSAEKFTEILAEKAIGLSFGATSDTLHAGLETLRKNKEEAFDLFRLALTSPRFDRKAVRRMKEQMYAGIEARKGNPNAVAGERWAKLVYGDHPYGHMIPTKQSVRAITRANLRSLIRDRIARDNMIIGVAGNISAEELKPLLEKTFAGLPKNPVSKKCRRLRRNYPTERTFYPWTFRKAPSCSGTKELPATILIFTRPCWLITVSAADPLPRGCLTKSAKKKDWPTVSALH